MTTPGRLNNVSHEQSAPQPSHSPTESGTDLLVVIDHREAKIYRSESEGAVPQKFTPYDPHGFRRHLHSENPETDGKRAPERKTYYEGVAKTLQGAKRILIFGSGTGESSAMEQLVADLKHNHHEVAAHIIGTVKINEHHTTEGELLAQARDFFATAPIH